MMNDKTSRTDQAVEEWFQKHIHNSPASRDEQVYAHLYQAKDALKAMLTDGGAETAAETKDTAKGGK